MSGSGAGGFSKSLICLVERPDKAPSTDGLAVTVEDVGEALIIKVCCEFHRASNVLTRAAAPFACRPW